MAADATIDELMCVVMAREVRDGDWVNHGAGVPLAGAALMLAKRTHAPSIDFFYAGSVFGSVNPGESNLATLMLDPGSAYRSARALMSEYDIVSFMARGGCTLQFLRPVQVDRFGNVNVSVIGTPERPRHRFHGIAVGDSMINVGRICLYVTDHDPRVFCDELSFRTGSGRGGGDWRRRIGAPGAGPTSVVTPLCVLDFDTPDERARVRSIHPGVSEAELRERTGFDLVVDADCAETVPASAEELDLLRREVDPLDTRKLEFKQFRERARARLAAHRG
jgi:glutaconate CoA-transferase subunit B